MSIIEDVPLDHDFIQQCFVAYAQQLYGYVYRSLGDPEQSKEIVQESFTTLLKKKGSWSDKAAVKAFLFRTARFHLLNLGRDRRLKGEAFDENAVAVAHHPNQLETTLLVRKALSQLPEELHTPLILKEFHGFKYAEIAAMLDLPVGTVRSRLHRARVDLLDTLEKMGGVP